MINFSEQWTVLDNARRSAPMDVQTLPAALGIGFKEAFLDPEISGMLEKNGNSFLITVNANDPATRQRFTLAHELGHYMLHRHLVGDGLDDNRVYRSTSAGKYHNTQIGPREETEANRFAASLLMPGEAIRREVAKFGKDPAKLADIFGVSKQTMSIRLGVPYDAA